jgi:hypothetical protein
MPFSRGILACCPRWSGGEGSLPWVDLRDEGDGLAVHVLALVLMCDLKWCVMDDVVDQSE